VILTDTVDIAAPVERVWSLTEDIEQWPSITPTVTSVVRLDHGPLGKGSTARVKQPRQAARVWTVTRFEPCDTFAWESRILGMHVVGTHSMTSSASGSVNTLTLEISDVMSKLLGRVLAPTLRKALAIENAGFKQRAEQTGPAT
jgi:uncharacterized membrane protein